MTAREKLIAWDDVYDQKGSSEIFMEAMRDCLKHHMEHNAFFKKYMEAAKMRPEELVWIIPTITPYIPQSQPKRKANALNCAFRPPSPVSCRGADTIC